jgi:hypothetical protein
MSEKYIRPNTTITIRTISNGFLVMYTDNAFNHKEHYCPSIDDVFNFITEKLIACR